MTWLYENPILVLLIGIGATAFATIGWLQTGRKSLVVAAAALLALAIGLFFLSRAVVTDREAAELTIRQIATDVEKGEMSVILGHVHSRATEVLTRASGEFPRFRVHRVNIRPGMKVEVFPQHQPPKATAEFNVVVTADVTSGELQGLVNDHSVPRFVTVTLYKEGDLWKVWDYAHYEPTEGLRDSLTH